MQDVMRIDLNCPYAEREAAKALGARWDAEKRMWFVDNPVDLRPFARWLPAEVRGFLLKSTSSSPPPQARRRCRWQAKEGAPELRNEGPTNYRPDWVPQEIPPGDPPW